MYLEELLPGTMITRSCRYAQLCIIVYLSCMPKEDSKGTVLLQSHSYRSYFTTLYSNPEGNKRSDKPDFVSVGTRLARNVEK